MAETVDLIDVKKTVVKIARDVAEIHGITPRDVSAQQFWEYAKGKVSDRQLRKLGGFTAVKEDVFEPPLLEKPFSKRFVPSPPPKLANFTCHDVSIEELFASAGLGKNDVFKMVVIPDMHIPQHDPYAVNAFLKFLSDYGAHGIINLGDFLEMDPVTHWPPYDARPKRLIPHILQAKQMLQQIEQAAGPQCKFKRFIIGNHEDWLQQYLVSKIPEVLDEIDQLGISLEYEALLGLPELGYKTIPLNQILRIGNHACFIHGYYTTKYHAAKHLDVFGVNVYYGHLHDVQHHSTVSVNGIHEAMSLGCLRSLSAPFLKGKPNNWSHAFGIFEFTSTGLFTRYVPVIIDGKFSYNGRLYDGTKS